MEIIIASIIGAIIWAAILESIISNASRSEKIVEQLIQQTNILTKMAEKQGITLDKIVIPAKKKGRFW